MPRLSLQFLSFFDFNDCFFVFLPVPIFTSHNVQVEKFLYTFRGKDPISSPGVNSWILFCFVCLSGPDTFHNHLLRPTKSIVFGGVPGEKILMF